jgi:hypothetical protein
MRPYAWRIHTENAAVAKNLQRRENEGRLYSLIFHPEQIENGCCLAAVQKQNVTYERSVPARRQHFVAAMKV